MARFTDSSAASGREESLRYMTRYTCHSDAMNFTQVQRKFSRRNRHGTGGDDKYFRNLLTQTVQIIVSQPVTTNEILIFHERLVITQDL